MREIQNPIIPGFNPDPSIIRVGEDYYIAVSTFEWFPGVFIYHSRDLAHWRLVKRPLDRMSQLDMTGVPDSGGVWAPCLSYSDGTYYLVYTIVRTVKGIWRDMHNYLVTADDIMGEWSDPVYLNSIGHDPSLYHDDDGKKYLMSAEWQYAGGRNIFAGIVLQEYSIEDKAPVGPMENIFGGSGAGFTEAPHIYKNGGYYYLITAEGGTWYDHCVTMARSKDIWGPYDLDPENPVLTSRDDARLALQKAGHADLVETQCGDWYMVHLCARPLSERGNCPLGRETAIQRVVWEDGWLRLAEGGHGPRDTVPVSLSEYRPERENPRDDFDGDALPIHFQTLRIPLGDDAVSLKARKGYLRLWGRESLASVHSQSLVARRLTAHRYTVRTALETDPGSSREMAGMVIYYNTENYYYICVSYQEGKGKILKILCASKGSVEESIVYGIPIDTKRYGLRITVDRDAGQCWYSLDERQWERVGPGLDMGRLSDDHIAGKAFTGCMAGMCCQDLSGSGYYADFDYFEIDNGE